MIRQLQTVMSLSLTTIFLPALLLHEATHAVFTYPVGSVPAAGVLIDTSKPYLDTQGMWVWCEHPGGWYSWVITLSPLIWFPIGITVAFQAPADMPLWLMLWSAYVAAAGFGGVGDLMGIVAPSWYDTMTSDFERRTLIGTVPD